MHNFINPKERAQLPPENGEENHLATSQKRKRIIAVCSTVFIMLLAVGGILTFAASNLGFFGDNGRAHADTATTEHSADHSAESQSVDQLLQSITDNQKPLSEMTDSELTEAVTQAQSKTQSSTTTPTNTNVAYTRNIERTETIAFTEENTTTANLPRGHSVITREGVNGERAVSYLVSFNQDGVILEFKKQSETITRSPVNQLVLTGTSDYNLNAGIMVTNYSSYTCLAIEGANGYDCADEVKLASAYQLADGPIYLQYFTDTSGQARSFTSPITVAHGSTFSFNGQLYLFGVILSSTTTLDATFCNNHGLACGSW